MTGRTAVDRRETQLAVTIRAAGTAATLALARALVKAHAVHAVTAVVEATCTDAAREHGLIPDRSRCRRHRPPDGHSRAIPGDDPAPERAS
jgi:hypothetical protein